MGGWGVSYPNIFWIFIFFRTEETFRQMGEDTNLWMNHLLSEWSDWIRILG